MQPRREFHSRKVVLFSCGESTSLMIAEESKKFTESYIKKLYVLVTFYQLANALILPLVPFLANNLNANAFEYGLVYTVYYVGQLISELAFLE